jgi:hypothetical protein
MATCEPARECRDKTGHRNPGASQGAFAQAGAFENLRKPTNLILDRIRKGAGLLGESR